MGFYRLIKPDWAKPSLANGEPNPKYIEPITGADVIEGYNFSPEFLTEHNQAGYNVYFFPNHPSKDVYSEGVRHLSGKHIDVFNFVFVDMDLKDGVYKSKEDFLEVISKFPTKPTMVVNSGNGIHAYWNIQGLTRDLYVITQLALINHFKTDESIYTVLQLMRLPGFNNTKRHKDYAPASVIESLSSGVSYMLSDFPPAIYDLSPVILTRAQNHLNKLDGKLKIDIPEFANLEELPDSFLDLIQDPANVAVFHLFTSPKETYGDRSGADMKLANILFKAGLNRKDALAVLSNTVKAISKGPHRFSYAQNTVDKVYIEKHNEKFRTVGQQLRMGDNEKNLGELVRGTWYMDTEVLGNPWRKKELLGLIAGTGVGKTSVTLKLIKDSIENNKSNDDVYVFFSLEMPEADIIDRWIKLVGSESPLAERLYVIGNEDEKGNPRNIGLQEIYFACSDIVKLTGKKLGMVAIDHIGIISKHIDTKRTPNFGIQSEVNSGFGPMKTLSLNSLAKQMKALAKLLDTFIVVLTQTTKEKQGAGDLPLGVDAAYGISDYENIMDRIISIWQPLSRVQNQLKTRFLAYQYVKIRNKHVSDKIQTYEPKLLTFDLGTGDLRLTNTDEYSEFIKFLPQAQEIRDNLLKKKGGTGYSIHLNLDALNKARTTLGIVPGAGS